MLPGPICSVELLTIARRKRYFILRAVYAGILLLFLWNVHYQCTRWQRVNDIAAVANFMAAFFSTFSILQILAVLLLGPALVAGAISTERERRTIEYLFASPLSNAEIVLGKLAARLWHTICLVLAGVPVLALAMLMGGIAPEALLLLMIVTLSTIVTVAALSIAVSVWTPRARDAVVRAYLLMFALLVLPPIASSLRFTMPSFHAWIAPLVNPLLAANPLWVFGDVLFQASSAAPGRAWNLVGALVRNHAIVSALAIAAGTLAVRRVHLKQAGKGGRKRRWRLQLFRGQIGNQPMLWKELFAEPAASRLGLLGHGILAVALGAVIWMAAYWFLEAVSRSFYGGESYIRNITVTGALISCGGLLLLASRAAGSVTSEKERDCWDSLISTPLAAREIVGAKVLGNLWAMRGLLVPLLALWLPGILLVPESLLAAAFTLAALLGVALFVSCLGVLFSLRSKNTLRAMAGTLVTCLIVGGGYLLCCMFAVFSAPGPNSGVEIIMAPCVPFLLIFPGMVSVEGMPRHESALVFGYGLGLIGYYVAALVLYSMAVDQFDSLTGRTIYNGPRPGSAPYRDDAQRGEDAAGRPGA